MLMCNKLGALFCAYAIQFRLSWPIIITCFFVIFSFATLPNIQAWPF